MENNKGQTIFLSVIGIATLLVAIIGATFAWFSVNVQGNENASSIIVTTAVLGNITFVDGSAIDLSNIRPEGDPSATKTFTIANATSSLSTPFVYQIKLNVTVNTLSAEVNETQGAVGVTGNWFVHTLSLVSNTGTGTTVAMAETAVPLVGDWQLGSNGTLVDVETHTYSYTIAFKDSGSNQNDGQGMSFTGALHVEEAE